MNRAFLRLCFFALSVSGIIYSREVRNHVSSICSTWGREHFKTFDGGMYQFPGLCEYNLVSDCHEMYQIFSVHMRRSENNGTSSISYLVVTINELSFHLTKNTVLVDNLQVKLPYYDAGVQVERNAVYMKLKSKAGLTVMWNRDDAVMVELDHDFAHRTCGLCGDFNGVQQNEFILYGREITPIEFGNKQKVHLPNDDCEEAKELLDSCEEFTAVCEGLFPSNVWSSCLDLVDPDPYIQACKQDMCSCTSSTNSTCTCRTLAEFSRQCSHAGGQPPNWRTPQFCDKQCPFNMVHEESGSPCMDTCTLPDTSSLCEEHKMDGCFCPPGTVFDDISMRGCVAQSECQCKHDKIYSAGEVYRQDGKNCTCSDGKWTCEVIQAPATCAVEEGSHVTTFDGKTYTFHGDCYYTLAKVENKNEASTNFTIRAQLVQCANQEFDTCLKNLKVLLNNDRNKMFTFTSDGAVKQTMQMITLPYDSDDIHIFHASSFHILLQTTFGLQIQIQLVPVMQVYVSLDQSYRGKTRGLCGNFNMILSDDMKTPQGIVEGTAASFSNSWKTNAMCPDREERLDDPCSLSVENELYAKHWCSLLLSPNSTFSRCRSMVDPDLYYKRCVYASCNCEKSEGCLCAVFSSYARACASKGVILTDWRDVVCDKYSRSCPETQTYFYSHQRCQLTCGSLRSEQQSCTSDFLPVDGCSCAEGLYLDDHGLCVPMEKCLCYYNEQYFSPGHSLSVGNDHCVCTNGIFECTHREARSSICTAPKVYFNCSAGLGGLGTQCTQTCFNLDIDDCESSECESGCKCPVSLYDDGKGSCVEKHECPCMHDGKVYAANTTVSNKCNKCTCFGGVWDCTKKTCPQSCIIYGSGHYTTFDQKTYGFQGPCDYVAVKNKCDTKAVQDFGVIIENVPCGSTGTTCSKTVRIQLGRKEIKLSKGKYEVEDLGNGTYLHYTIRKAGLYLLVESEVGLSVMWDHKTTVRILLEPQHSGEICGLCGNFDGDGQNDFTTQAKLVVSRSVEFANSWKASSTCPDVELITDPCKATPKRHHWAKMMCSIIIGDTFKSCHSKVDPLPFHDNCVRDSCACDTGGDCECFCTAVAAYAQACNEAGVCVAWRSPDVCPVFCDYYNNQTECLWHYQPCHTPCYKTCQNPQGVCNNSLPNLEGCFPKCPQDKPIFDENKQLCVENCVFTTPVTTTQYTPVTPTTLATVTTTTKLTTTTQATTTPPSTTKQITTTTQATTTLSTITTTTKPTTATRGTTTPPSTTKQITTTTQATTTMPTITTTTKPTTTTQGTTTATTTLPTVTTTTKPTTTTQGTTTPPSTTKQITTTTQTTTTLPTITTTTKPTTTTQAATTTPSTAKQITTTTQATTTPPSTTKQTTTAAQATTTLPTITTTTKPTTTTQAATTTPSTAKQITTTTQATTTPPSTTKQTTTTTQAKTTLPTVTTTTKPTTTTQGTTTAPSTTKQITTTTQATTTLPTITTTTKPTTTTQATTTPPSTTKQITTTTQGTTTLSTITTTTKLTTTTQATTTPPSTTKQVTTTTQATTTPPSTTKQTTTTTQATTTLPTIKTSTKPTTTTQGTTTPPSTTKQTTTAAQATTTLPTITTTTKPTTTTQAATTTPSTAKQITTTTQATTTPPSTTKQTTTTTQAKTTLPTVTTTTKPTTTTQGTTTAPSTTKQITTTTQATTTPLSTTKQTTTTTQAKTTLPTVTTTTKPTTTTQGTTTAPSTTKQITTTTQATTTFPTVTTTTKLTTTTQGTTTPPSTTKQITTTTQTTTTLPTITTTTKPTTTTQAATTTTSTAKQLTTTTQATTTPPSTTKQTTTAAQATTTLPTITTTTKPTTTTQAATTTPSTAKQMTTTTQATTTPPSTTKQTTTTTQAKTTLPTVTTTTKPTTTTQGTTTAPSTTKQITTTTQAKTTLSTVTTTTKPTTTTQATTTPPSTTKQITTNTQATTTLSTITTTTKPTTTTQATTKPPSTTKQTTTTTQATTTPPSTTKQTTTTTQATTTLPTINTFTKPTTTTQGTTTPPSTAKQITTTTQAKTTLSTVTTTTKLPTTTQGMTTPPSTNKQTTTTTQATTTLPTITTSTKPTTTTQGTTTPPSTTKQTTTTTQATTTPPSTTKQITTTTQATTTLPTITTTTKPTTTTQATTTLPITTTTTKPTTTTQYRTPTTSTTKQMTTSTQFTTLPPTTTTTNKASTTARATTTPLSITKQITTTKWFTTTANEQTTFEPITHPTVSTTRPITNPIVVATSAKPNCPDWGVSQNETFLLCNCTMARCIENNTVEIIPYKCPPLENITCSNGMKPVLVYDEYHCCQHYACDCACEGWGDSHYITFDGFHYSYQGNCTYVLMEETSPKHNLKIYIDNVICDPNKDVSCPQSIHVSYKSHVFTLINRAAQLKALKDGVRLKLPFSDPSVKILDTGINLVLEIPHLRAVITFGITGFSLNLPFEFFGTNTQGHCGTCNNNQTDDCMLPGGSLAQSCAVMADYWFSKNISQNCKIPSAPPTNFSEPPPTFAPCNPDSICDLLKSSVFEKCHPFVSPDKVYQGCVFDSCHVSNPAVECTSLQTYAAACAQAGVCIHWRNHTKLCTSDCPSNKVYKPCGPAEQPTCEDSPNEPTLNFTTEGCFCPDGMKLFNKESGICVDKCGCLDPEGIPRKFNERFDYKCQSCICEESTKTVTCTAKECPAPPLKTCSEPGFVLVNQTSPIDPCCSTYVCQCQINTCPADSMKCTVGYVPVVSVPEGKCCPEHTCEPKRVCVYKNIEYQLGSAVPVNVCQNCTCSNMIQPDSNLFRIYCELLKCDETCDLGYEYVQDPNECCGKCVQTHCVLSLNGSTQLLRQEETWSSSDSMCEYYNCFKSGQTLVTTSSQVICPPFDPNNCKPVSVTY
ncbi:mucin-2 [Betta splendens]|uniref:Mucin-2 n=1 Tax=Betta splendens TaxID=158456 RepID=A0A9W2XW44_BETSP|nr:mucin-2 [Betta splendens]